MGIVPSSRSGVGRGGSARLRWWLVLWVLLDPRPQRRRSRQPQPKPQPPPPPGRDKQQCPLLLLGIEHREELG